MYSCKFLPKTKSNHKIDPEYRWDTNKLISSRDNPMWTWSVCPTDWLTDKPLFSFNSRYDEWWPLLALMFLPTKHPMIDSETSASQSGRPGSPCIFCSIVDLTSLYLLPYFTIIRPQLGCSLEVFLNIIQQNNTSYWCISMRKPMTEACKNKILVTQLDIVTFFCYCTVDCRTMLTF